MILILKGVSRHYLTSLQRPYLTTNISIDQLTSTDRLKPVLTAGPVSAHTDRSIANLCRVFLDSRVIFDRTQLLVVEESLLCDYPMIVDYILEINLTKHVRMVLFTFNDL